MEFNLMQQAASIIGVTVNDLKSLYRDLFAIKLQECIGEVVKNEYPLAPVFHVSMARNWEISQDRPLNYIFHLTYPSQVGGLEMQRAVSINYQEEKQSWAVVLQPTIRSLYHYNHQTLLELPHSGDHHNLAKIIYDWLVYAKKPNGCD